MVTQDDFFSAVEFAKKIERSAVEHTEFKENVEVVRAIELYPDEYVALNFADLVNLYERTQKIMSATKLEIYGAGVPQIEKKAMAAKTAEVEEKVKGITTERLEEIKEQTELEKPVTLPEIKHVQEASAPPKEEISLIEFEKVEEEKEKKPDFEFEIEKKEDRRIEEKKAPQLIPTPEITPPLPKEKEIAAPEKIVEARVIPEVLETPEEAGNTKYADIEEYLTREWGGVIEESKIKRKMLDLTKELFKEKSTARREKIKLEIVVLKNMLTGLSQRPKAKAAPKEYSANLLETVLGTQTTEFSSSKDSLLSSYKKRISDAKKDFYEKLKGVPEEDIETRKSIYENFTAQLSALGQTLPTEMAKIRDFVMQKHQSEIDNFKKSLPKDEVSLIKKVDSRLDEIEGYNKEFDAISDIIMRNIESLIETGANEVVAKEKKEMEVSSILYEINETDEGTLLYFLHSKDPDLYKKYERNRLAREEALHYARVLMAKEKGLSQAAIKKHFGSVEHMEDK